MVTGSLMTFYCKFPAEWISGRNLKIGLYLAKIIDKSFVYFYDSRCIHAMCLLTIETNLKHRVKRKNSQNN